jgi:hypothetical protein
MSHVRSRLRSVLTALILLVISSAVSAQTSKGFIVGNVTDPNGAAVAGATVRITNPATGATRETTTQEDGAYRFDAVDPGTYNVEVGSAGFRTTTRSGVIVAAAQTTDAAIQLEIGAATESVTVLATNPIELQSADGARVNTLDQRQITDLPVPALNPVNLVFTLPGVVDPGPLAGGFVQGTEFSVNGLRARSNSQLIDGLENNDNSVAGQFYQPVLRDGYDEVTVLQSDYSAEFGRAGGAVVNVITRRGTNDFHGSIYDVINNRAITSLGGDPTVMSPCADTVMVSSLGLLQVLTDPRTNVAQCLQAILTAELTDNDGWRMLINLAEELGHADLASEFHAALTNEETHLASVRGWLEELVLAQAQA